MHIKSVPVKLLKPGTVREPKMKKDTRTREQKKWDKLRHVIAKELPEMRKAPYNNAFARKERELQRHSLEPYLPSFDKTAVKNTLIVRYELLDNYICNFGEYFRPYYATASKKIRKQIIEVLGEERLAQIMHPNKKKKYITINEVFNLYCVLPLKKDFAEYFASKTSMSFSIHGDKIRAITNFELLCRTPRPIAVKFSQFVHMILCEYIAMHNLMFCSGYKLKAIKSIDKWLKDI